MNHKVIEELKTGEISLRIVQPDTTDPLSRKYWLKAGFGHLELDGQAMEDLFDVVIRFYQCRDPRAFGRTAQRAVMAALVVAVVTVLAVLTMYLAGR